MPKVGEVKKGMRSSIIQTYILSILIDCKKHTISEIAEKVEISYSTAQRHISQLATYFPIITIPGGRDTGGVQMLQSYDIISNFFDKEELLLLLEGVKLLEGKGEDVTSLIAKLTPASDESHADTPATPSARRQNGWDV